MDRKKLNLEQTVQYLLDVVESGIKPEKWLVDTTELASYVTDANVGKYYLVGSATGDQLYYITRRHNDGLIADNLGDFPRKGEQGVAGQKGASPVVTISRNNTWVIDGVDTGKPSRGTQGEKGNDGIAGKGITNLEEISSASYTPTFTEETNDVLVETSAKIDFGTQGEKVFDLKFKVPKGDELPQVLEDLADNIDVTEDGSVEFGHDVYADGSVEAGTDVTVGRNMYIDAIDNIQDTDGNKIVKNAIDAKSTVTGTNDGTNWQTVTIDGVTKNIPSGGGSTYSAGDGITISGTEISAKVGTGLFFDANDRIAFNNLAQTVYNSGITSSKVSTYDGYATQISSKSTVSGTNDGTNWQTVTIDGVTKNIPVGGGSSLHLYKHVCYGSSGDNEYSITAITTSPLSIADDNSRLNYSINVTDTGANLGVLGYYTNASDINTLAVYIAGTNNDMYIYGLDGEYIDEAFITEDTVTQIA